MLIVDDEDEVRASLSELFASEGIACLATASPEEARDWIAAKNGLRVLITDVRMPGMTGMDLLRAAGRLRPDLAVIVMTGFPSVENAVSAMKLGALNFYSKPVNFQALLDEARGILASPAPPSGTGAAIVTRDPRMLAILDQLERAAATDAPVVILGESGTGKELFARRLHLLSPRRDNNYLCLNCAALPESLLESELFGHEKGAFTGADSARKGRFELADRGTLFLDEIGDMPAATQAKILRAIEQGVFERLGGESGIRADLRIVAASNKDLRALIAEGAFREDLYYRLAVVTVELPPLRERPGDVPLLVEHYLGEFNRQYGKAVAGVEPEAMEILARHNWPGNVRELRNCVQRTAIFRDDGLVSVGDLPEQYRAGIRDPAAGESRREKLRELDRDLIKRTLEECDGVKGRAAERLRIHRKTLYNRMKSLGLGD